MIVCERMGVAPNWKISRNQIARARKPIRNHKYKKGLTDKIELRPVYTKRLRLRLPLTLTLDANAFYIKLYRRTQSQTLGVNRPLQIEPNNIFTADFMFLQVLQRNSASAEPCCSGRRHYIHDLRLHHGLIQHVLESLATPSNNALVDSYHA